MNSSDKLTRIRRLLAEGQQAPSPQLTGDDTLGRVLRAAAPWGVLLVRAYLANGIAVMVWGFWFFFRFNHEWSFIRWTISEHPIFFFAAPFVTAVPLGILSTLMVFLAAQVVKKVRASRVKGPLKSP